MKADEKDKDRESFREGRMSRMDQKDICRSCIDCGALKCRQTAPEENREEFYPGFCLTTKIDDAFVDEVQKLYTEDEINGETAIAAAKVEAEYYCKMTRIEEIMEFARQIGAKKLGIATCVGLMKEARIAARIFRAHGFEVYGVSCKAGARLKTSVGIPKECESAGVNMCNPILQAKLLNGEKTDLNVVIGLCVGHDSLFYKYSEAVTTTLVTKDRVLGHNPVAALYQADSYYRRLLEGSGQESGKCKENGNEGDERTVL